MRLNYTLLLILAISLTSACGGGGVTGSNSVPPPAAEPQPQPQPQPQPEPEPDPQPAVSFKIEEFYPGFCGLDGEVRNQHTGYTASGYADSSNSVNASITWKFEVQSAGMYSLTWTYALASGVYEAELSADGGNAQNISFSSTGASTTWAAESLDLNLSSGIHTLVLSASSANGLPNIDSLTVEGDNARVVNCDDSPVPQMTPNTLCVAGATFQDTVVDCGGARIGSSCNGDDESQDPLITLRNATVKNLILAADGGADGIHCREGDCVLENVIWEDVCEDAATNRSDGGSMHILGGWAFNNTGGWGGDPDKIFQHNSVNNSTTQIDGGFIARGVNGKLWRSCGNCSNNNGPRHLIIDDVRIEGSIGSVVGLNVNFGDTATISNLAIENYGSGNPEVCEQYTGVQSGQSSPSLGEAWNTENCLVDPDDIVTF